MKRILTLVFAGYSALAFGQWIQYADANTHARGIAASKGKIYLSANTGLIYEYNISKDRSTCLNMGKALEELRDIDVNGKRLVSMQSKNSSKLIYKLNNQIFNYNYRPIIIINYYMFKIFKRTLNILKDFRYISN